MDKYQIMKLQNYNECKFAKYVVSYKHLHVQYKSFKYAERLAKKICCKLYEICSDNNTNVYWKLIKNYGA